MSTLWASAVFGVKTPSSKSFTRLSTLQKLGFGERDLARGPVFSVVFVFLVPAAFFLVGVAPDKGFLASGAGVLSRVAGTERFIFDIFRFLEEFSLFYSL
jgi:hypothetical protein